MTRDVDVALIDAHQRVTDAEASRIEIQKLVDEFNASRIGEPFSHRRLVDER